MLGKGPERPINEAADRKTVLEALQAVDAVIVFKQKRRPTSLQRYSPACW